LVSFHPSFTVGIPLGEEGGPAHNLLMSGVGRCLGTSVIQTPLAHPSEATEGWELPSRGDVFLSRFYVEFTLK